jgi:hypothetical protein
MLAMSQDWLVVVTPTQAEAWNIPVTERAVLNSQTNICADLLKQAQSSTRNPVITEQCREAFEALETIMRDWHRRYFLIPPLSLANFVQLLLPIPDDTRTPIPAPVDQPGIEINKWAPHTLGFRRFTATDLGGSKSDYGVRVYYALTEGGVLAPSEVIMARRFAPNFFILTSLPQSPEDLTSSFFTRREYDLIEFPPEASGKTCYIAARFENGKGQSGPWGTMINAIVP